MSLRVVVLAAGASSRLGEPKALASIGGRAVLDWMLSAVQGAQPEGAAPLVVTGAHHEEIAAFLGQAADRDPSPLRADVARSAEWASGRTAGVQLAAQRCRGEDLLVWPADVPLVPSAILSALIDEWRARRSPSRGWLAPAVHAPGTKSALAETTRFGHPVLIGRDLVEEVGALAAADPLWVLRKRAQPLWSLPVQDEAVLDDLDTPEDLAQLRRRARAQDA